MVLSEKYGLGTKNKHNRVYEKWVVFYDHTAPFITLAKPMAIDFRKNKNLPRGDLNMRELRITRFI